MMNNFSSLIMLLFFASCGNNPTSQKSIIKPDFNLFIDKFKNDSVFQKQHMNFPVMEYYSDEDFPLDLMERNIDEENYSFIKFDTDSVAKKNKNEDYKVIIQSKKNTVFYHKMGVNNSINENYKFIYKNGSYYLVEIIDLTN